MGREMLRFAQHDSEGLSMTFSVVGDTFHHRAPTHLLCQCIFLNLIIYTTAFWWEHPGNMHHYVPRDHLQRGLV